MPSDPEHATEGLLAHLEQTRARQTPPPDRPPIEPDPDVVARQRELRAAAWEGVVPPVYGDPTLAKLRTGDENYPPADPVVVDALTAWAADPVRNLVLLGPVGTAKSYAAWAALRRAYGTGRSVRGIGAVDMLDALRPDGPPGAAAELRTVDLLFVDDVGAQRDTDWTDERLYALIHHRWENCRPLVVAANLDPGPLAEVLGPRSYSRLVGDAVVLRLTGPDRRRLRKS